MLGNNMHTHWDHWYKRKLTTSRAIHKRAFHLTTAVLKSNVKRPKDEMGLEMRDAIDLVRFINAVFGCLIECAREAIFHCTDVIKFNWMLYVVID